MKNRESDESNELFLIYFRTKLWKEVSKYHVSGVGGFPHRYDFKINIP